MKTYAIFDGSECIAILTLPEKPIQKHVELTASLMTTVPQRLTMGENGKVTKSNPDMTDDEVIAAMQKAEQEKAAANFASRPLKISQLDYMNLFTDSELEAIYTAADVSVSVRIEIKKLEASEFIDLHDPRTRAGLEKLVAAGLIAAERVDVILRNEVPTAPAEPAV